MSHQITLKAEPFAPMPSPAGGTAVITATVTDAAGEPLADIEVSFRTGVPYARFNAAAGMTDDRGQTRVSLTFPSPDAIDHSGAGVIPVTAASAQGSTTLLINFHDPFLKPVRILNAQKDEKTGITRIGNLAISLGVQAGVYFPDTLADGDKATFYWGKHSTRKTCAKGEYIWVVEPEKLFPAEQVLRPGEYRIWYSIENASGEVTGSEPVDIVIVDSPYSVSLA